MLPSQGTGGQPSTGSTIRKHPVVVIGASATGLFTSYLLARQGVPVRVIERSPQLDPASRTLIVTARMREILGEAGEQSVVNEIHRFELFTDGRAATITLNQPDLIIERSELIRGLAAVAVAAGAEVALGKQFQALRPNGNGLKVEVTEAGSPLRSEFTADTVVAADGAVSRVAAAAGWPSQQTVPLIQAIVRLPRDMPPDTVRVWFVPQDTPYFYWLIPESESRGALGLIGVRGREVRGHLESFLRKRGLEALAFQGARIPVYRRWTPVRRKVGRADVYLVGDAAGQVKVTTVGGIVTGLRGAVGVADAILTGGASSELNALRRELNWHLLLRKSLHHFQQADYSRLVDLLNDPARRSLGECSRDNALKLLWKVCANQPRLVLMGLRGLLTRGRFSEGEQDVGNRS